MKGSSTAVGDGEFMAALTTAAARDFFWTVTEGGGDTAEGPEEEVRVRWPGVTGRRERAGGVGQMG